MAIGFPAKGDDVPTLIAKKNYAKAIELIKAQLKTGRQDPRLRLQLADALELAGRPKDAVTILVPLADEFATEGFSAKAISVLKRIQKLDPSRRDIDGKVASLIQQKQSQATIPPPAPAPSFELGMEEIGFDIPMGGGPVNVPAEPVRRAPEPEPVRAPGPVRAPEPAPVPAAPRPAPVAPPVARPKPAAAPPPKPAPVAAPPPPPPEPEPEFLELPPLAPEPFAEPFAPEPVFEPVRTAAEPVVEAQTDEVFSFEPPPADGAGDSFDFGGGLEEQDTFDLSPTAFDPPAPVADQDLFVEGDDALAVEPMALEPEIEPDPDPDNLMTDSLFADELLSVIDQAFQDFPSGPDTSASSDGADEPEAGSQIVVSPLFKDFSVDELVAVIQGLNLITFDQGKIILREGDPGGSLYMLTSGTVRAFVKQNGKQVPIGDLTEGAFFGEGSILTGKPRGATIVAASPCELLELDRANLDEIVKSHPHVWNVLKDFADQRAAARKS